MGVGWLVVVAVFVVVAVKLAVVVVSQRMIRCVNMVGFSCFIKRCNGWTYRWMDLWTLDRPSYRDVRMHLKIV